MKSCNNLPPENTGLKLLNKGRGGVLRVVFSRAGLIILLLLMQVALLLVVQSRFRGFMPHYYAINTVISAIVILYLINSRIDPTAKLTWLMVIMIMPAFGSLLLLYTRSDVGHRMLKKRFATVMEETKDFLQQDRQLMESFESAAPEAAGLVRYLSHTGSHPLWRAEEVEYFPLGEDKFCSLMADLQRAEKFIFMEYFIVDEGYMWGQILQVLADKAAQGVDVRIMYDGTCELVLLPHNYPARLNKLGIKCKVFAPLTPFVSTHYNYRDHRKIAVIDGRVAYTGGVNLADEYINRIRRFGHWKDTAVKITGPAVNNFTLMFLQMWLLDKKLPEIGPYIVHEAEGSKSENGFVLPYGDCPLDDEKVGELVYMDILNRARNYVYIMTPYLILDGEMETAIKFAAERGVDVRIILPGIPDKKLPYALAKTHYGSLLDSGVKIYEYSPGFVHAKVFLCDDREAVVGTINLDYRSLYHHFECACYINGAKCIGDIKADFDENFEKCRVADKSSFKEEKLFMKIAGVIMKIIAPLL